MNKRYCNGMVHVIKQGETLYQLSRRYRVPLALILRANPYVDVYNLQVGQEICIPVVRPYNGMICMPVQAMPRENEGMQGEPERMPMDTERDMERNMDRGMNQDMNRNMNQTMNQNMNQNMNQTMNQEEFMEREGRSVRMESENISEDSRMGSRGFREEGCPVCQEEELEKLDQDDRDDRVDDDVEIYITTGGRSLGDILKEYGVNWEEFIKNNNLDQIVLGDDVVLYLPKKTAR